MRTAAKVILVSSVAAALGVALWKRRRIASAAASAAVTTEIVAKKAVDVVRAAVGKYGKIAGSTVDNFRRYNLSTLIDQYRGDLPWALAAAVIEIESGGNPEAANRSGARGILQILSQYNRGLTDEQRHDPEASMRVIFPELAGFARKARAAGVTDPYDIARYVYYGHNAGAAALAVILKHAGEGFDKAVGYYRNMPWVKPSAKVDPEAHERNIDTLIRKRIAVANRVASHMLAWATIENQVKAGNLSAALGSFVVEIDEPITVYEYEEAA